MGKQLLLADDSLTIQKVVELTFMDEDFEIVAVGSGDEALRRLEAGAPDIVIADVHMPGASGYEVCRQAKSTSPGVPVLLLVGTFEALDEGELAACGADGHLKKPFDSQELLQLVRRMVSQAAARQPAAPEPEPEPEAQVVEGFESTHHGEFEERESDAAGFSLDFGVFGDEGAEASGELEVDLSGMDSRDSLAAGIDLGLDSEAPPEPEASPVPGGESPDGGARGLSDSDVERLARRVVELMSADTVREVAWDVIPDMAEIVIKERIRELEAEVE